MFVVVVFLITGILLGLSIGKMSIVLRLNEGLLIVTIYLTLFILAFSTGVDDMIVKSIDSIGWTPFLLTVVITILGILTFWIFYRNYSARAAKNKLYIAGGSK